MRHLTFRGFLGSYVRHLAGTDTLALRRLAALTPSEPRLTEPLLLWSVKSGSGQRLASLLERPNLNREVDLLLSLEREQRLESALAREDPRLREEYLKVWRSYVARRDAPAREAELKLEARKQVLTLEAEKGVSRYRMAKDLGLNPGNLHAFLAQANPGKVSLDRALALVEYLKAA